MTLQEVLKLAKQLSPIDKVRLIKQITPELEQELSQQTQQPTKSLWGLCQELGRAPSAEEIDQTRNEEWGNFPREDI
ncbi:MAG: hypothetical protein AAGA80_14485 [Cyanobacteria bacterium P01_F01_bin.143]